MNTGLNNIKHIWDTEMWENHTSIKSWKYPHIEDVEGSDGTQFRPGHLQLFTNMLLTAWHVAQISNSNTYFACK